MPGSGAPNTPIDPLNNDQLVDRLMGAAQRLGVESEIDAAELEHLVGVLSRCSLLIENVYTDDRLRAVLVRDPRRLAALVAAPWFRLPGAGDLATALFRVRRLPDRIRQIGDQALFDLSISGRSEVRGVALEDLGPKAYGLAAEVLELLADDARLREHFLSNQLGPAIPIEDEVQFLRRCSERFDIYSQMLRKAGGAPDETGSALLLPAPEVADDGSHPVPDASALVPSAGDRIFTDGRSPREQLLSAYERLLLFASVDLTRLRDQLAARVVDQHQAIDTLIDDFSLYAVGTHNLARPSSYFLVGPTGVGKNYLVETLVKLLEDQWEIDIPLLTIEGPNYTYPSDINELRGATRGFIRSDEPGLLTEFYEAAGQAPLSVIIVDEVEKADAQLRKFFLPIMDRGVTTDAKGNELHFGGTLIFFTSNIGYTDRASSPQPIGFDGEEKVETIYQSDLNRSLRRTLSPEFINRVKVVRFESLPRESAARILKLEFDKIARRYKDLHGLDLILTRAGAEALLDLGYSAEYGARHLSASLERTCNVEVSKKLRRDETGERDPSLLLERLREIRASEAPVDLSSLDRDIARQTRAKVPYRQVIIDAEDGEIVYRHDGA